MFDYRVLCLLGYKGIKYPCKIWRTHKLDKNSFLASWWVYVDCALNLDGSLPVHLCHLKEKIFCILKWHKISGGFFRKTYRTIDVIPNLRKIL
jgi:hypothetical protein